MALNRGTARYDKMPRPKVGLVENPEGVPFECGACVFFGRKKPGHCDNPDSELEGRKVDAHRMCCDFYYHPGMRIIVK